MQSANHNQEEMQHVVISVPAGIADKAPTAPTTTTDNQQPQQQPRWSLARRLLVGGAVAAISVGAVHMVFEGQQRRNHHRMMELGLEDEDGNDVGPRGGDEMSQRGGGKYGGSHGRPEHNEEDMMPRQYGHRGENPQRDGENRPEGGRPQRGPKPDGENRPEGGRPQRGPKPDGENRPQRDGENRPEGGRPQRGPKPDGENRPQRDGENRPEGGRPQRGPKPDGENRPQRGAKPEQKTKNVVSPVLAAPKQPVDTAPKVAKAAV
eukprot:TRINITY_DN405_c0_g1_i23.p1 TRINITY_DN405_c0_g1~~TRINITY_DN405_c0_g1_i23.p1  ORF type:complete len:264 (+),score=83.84 TRINITY_DN405_c0_g1_i23:153-944(+)